MKFSLWNLKEWYEVHGLDLSYHITESDASISMLAVSDTAAEGRLGCAIVELGEHCPDCSGFHTVLSFGRDRILFPVASPADVLDLGASMIEVFRQWENRLLDRIFIGDVGLQRENIRFRELCFQILCRFQIQVTENDPAAFVYKALDDRAANIPCPAGNKDHFIFKMKCHRFPSFL